MTETIDRTKEDVVESMASTEEKPKSQFLEINSWDDFRRVIVTARGGDPDAQQTLNAFLQFNNPIERTNLPAVEQVKAVGYLAFCGKTYFPDDDDNPFTQAAHCMSVAFMAKGGEKSKQFVELMKTTPSITDLQTLGDSAQRSVVDRVLGRGKSE